MLEHFINKDQLAVMQANCYGEEGEFFGEKITEFEERIRTMPKVYEQENANPPIAFLHYFGGAVDVFITERDTTDEQLQAFGWVNLGYGGEWGYVSIQELIAAGIELDLYYEPAPFVEPR